MRITRQAANGPRHVLPEKQHAHKCDHEDRREDAVDNGANVGCPANSRHSRVDSTAVVAPREVGDVFGEKRGGLAVFRHGEGSECATEKCVQRARLRKLDEGESRSLRESYPASRDD